MPRLKLPRPKDPPQLVEIEWLDAAVHSSYEGPGDLAPGLVTLCTCGYHIENSRRVVKIASDYAADTGEIRTVHAIPRVHITRFTPMVPETHDSSEQTPSK